MLHSNISNCWCTGSFCLQHWGSEYFGTTWSVWTGGPNTSVLLRSIWTGGSNYFEVVDVLCYTAAHGRCWREETLWKCREVFWDVGRQLCCDGEWYFFTSGDLSVIGVCSNWNTNHCRRSPWIVAALLLCSSDVEFNLGPVRNPCTVCSKSVRAKL